MTDRESDGQANLTDATAILESVSAERMPALLATLNFYLGQAARGSYQEAGVLPVEAAKQLASFNEMQIAVASDLMKLLVRSDETRSPAALMDTLEHWGKMGGTLVTLKWAVSKALPQLSHKRQPEG